MSSFIIIISPIIEIIINALVTISFAYFLVLVLYYMTLAIIGAIEERRRRLESEEENYSIMASSSFTFPVSVIVPAHNEEVWIADSLGSVMRQNYPQFEIIVVNDGSTDGTLDILKSMLQLSSIDKAYVHKFKDGGVTDFLQSSTTPQVTVVCKVAGYKKAGAINAGLNIARYKYICIMDADTVLEPNALMEVMAEVQKDPERIIGIGSYFGLSNGLKIKDGQIIERNFSYKPLIAYQNLEYIRSFVGNRLAWSRFNIMPTVPGGFGLWRRDVMAEIGGFDKGMSSEDMEYTFRAHDYAVRNKDKGYKILMLPYFAGWTNGPSNIKGLLLQRNRWQRVTEETLWKYKYMIFNPRYGGMGFLVMPYYLLYEVFGAFFEFISLFLLGLGFALGSIDIRLFGALFLFMMLAQGIVSLSSILAALRGQKLFNSRYTAYLILLGFLELLWYHWIISFAKISGTYSYSRRDRKHDQYEREKRN